MKQVRTRSNLEDFEFIKVRKSSPALHDSIQNSPQDLWFYKALVHPIKKNFLR